MRSGGARGRPGTAYAAALAGLAALALAGCATGPSDPGTPAPTSPSAGTSTASASPSATTPPPAPSSSTPVPVDPAEFSASPATGGTAWPGPEQASLVRVAAACHEGYDRVVLEFAEGPVPEYEVTPQAHATFPQDPSDLPVDLPGDSGVRVVVRGTVLAPSAADRLDPRCAAVRAVERVGDFEGVVSYGVGVAGVAQVRVTTLTSPARLVVDVLAP